MRPGKRIGPDARLNPQCRFETARTEFHTALGGDCLPAHARQEPVQARAAYAQHLRGADAIAVAVLQHALDVNPSHFVERQGAPVLARGGCVRLRLLEIFGQVSNVDEIGASFDRRAGNHIAQLAHVARPTVLQQRNLRALREPAKRFPISLAVLLQEVLYQQGDVLWTFCERGHPNLYAAEAKKEILSEAPRTYLGAKVAVGRGDQLHVHLLYFRGSDALDFAIVNRAKELSLQGKTDLSNLVQEYRAPISRIRIVPAAYLWPP